MIKHDGASVLASPIVTSIADEVSKSPAQVLIRWALQRGTSVVPKSVTPSRIESNLDVFSWTLSDDQMRRLSTIEPQVRMLHGDFWIKPGGPYKSVKELWDEE